MNHESPLEILRRKLEELLTAEAYESDAEKKFQLQGQIKATRERIRDLEADQAPPTVEQGRQVVPKGLRAFDEHDAGFFLQLLPGPDGRKVLIVIDQFEQWLHARQEADFVSLVGPLGECDGGRIQALLLIRVDFWMPLRRFMRQLHIPLEEDTNTADVDLFDQSHARRVLTLFGRSYDDPKGLPKTGELNRQQELFLDRAIQQLGEPDEGGRIKCVRLSLFADMIQDRPWEQGVLKSLGGATGVGVAFLEDRLSAKTAPATNRIHQQAARKILEALLPPEGTEIRGGMQPRRELLSKSGYQGRPDDFAELLKILDTQLRIITPTTPTQLEPAADEVESRSDEDDYYQLTHDYLVPSIRQWLTQERRKTRRGRAELVLQERAQAWDSKRESRSLPSSLEFARILCRSAESP